MRLLPVFGLCFLCCVNGYTIFPLPGQSAGTETPKFIGFASRPLNTGQTVKPSQAQAQKKSPEVAVTPVSVFRSNLAGFTQQKSGFQNLKSGSNIAVLPSKEVSKTRIETSKSIKNNVVAPARDLLPPKTP